MDGDAFEWSSLSDVVAGLLVAVRCGGSEAGAAEDMAS